MADETDNEQADEQEATGTEASPEEGQEATGEGGGTEPEPERKYSDKDVDGIVAKRLARERSKMEREIRDQVAKESSDSLSEAEKLRHMTELERAQYEARKLKAEKAELEGRIALSEMMDTARSELGGAGIDLPDELLRMFVSKDADKTSAAIGSIKELWPKAVSAAVKAALKREPPKADRDPAAKSVGAEFAEQYTKRMNGGK